MTDCVSEDRLDQIEVRLAAATPGPWDVVPMLDDGRVEIYVPNGSMDTETILRFVDYADCDECGRPSLYDATLIAEAPSDIAWLIAEVRRMRDEHSDHTAAKYWRTIQAQQRMIEKQAETIERMESALKAIAGDRCMRLTSGNCWTHYERDAEYLADRWCDACIAADGLRGES